MLGYVQIIIEYEHVMLGWVNKYACCYFDYTLGRKFDSNIFKTEKYGNIVDKRKNQSFCNFF